LRQNPDQSGQEEILASLDTINRQISSSEVKDIAGFLFPPQAHEETAPRAGNDAFLGYMESSVKLYSSLAQAAKAVKW